MLLFSTKQLERAIAYDSRGLVTSISFCENKNKKNLVDQMEEEHLLVPV